MKKIALIACSMIRGSNLCPGDAKCLVALGRKEGEFKRYENQDVSLVGIVDCGGCEGNQNRVVCSMALLNMHLKALNEKVDAIHVSTCITKYCKKKDDLIEAIRQKAGVEVVEGTHDYIPPSIFGQS